MNKNDAGRTVFILRMIILILGAAMVIIGLLGGEFTVVFNKAVRICLECIGIG